MTVANSLIASSSAVAKVNLLGLSRQQLEDFFTDLGEKRFRAQQVMKWIHHQGVIDFADMSNLGKGLREKLGSLATITPPEIADQQDSADGTRKWAIRDRRRIGRGRIDSRGRKGNVVCLFSGGLQFRL